MNKRQANIILIVLAIIFCFSSTYIYMANKAVTAVSKFNDTILSLILLDNELSFTLENNVLRLNYDDVNKNLRSFDQNLTRLDELNAIIQVFYQEKNAKTLKVINDDFLKKQRLVDRSNYASSSMAAYILSGEFEIASEKKLDALNVIFHAIKSSALISPETLNQTKEQIEKYKDTYKNDTKAILVLNKVTHLNLQKT